MLPVEHSARSTSVDSEMGNARILTAHETVAILQSKQCHLTIRKWINNNNSQSASKTPWLAFLLVLLVQFYSPNQTKKDIQRRSATFWYIEILDFSWKKFYQVELFLFLEQISEIVCGKKTKEVENLEMFLHVHWSLKIVVHVIYFNW